MSTILFIILRSIVAVGEPATLENRAVQVPIVEQLSNRRLFRLGVLSIHIGSFLGEPDRCDQRLKLLVYDCTHVWLVLGPLLLQVIVIQGRLFGCATPWTLVSEFLLDEVLLRESAHIGAPKYRCLHMDSVCFAEVMVHIHFLGPHGPLLDRSRLLHLLIYLDWLVASIKVEVIWVQCLSAQQIFDSPNDSIEQGIF